MPRPQKGGPSPNPSGKKKRLDGERADGWLSALTGLGHASWDKRESATYGVDLLSPASCRAIWRGDDLAARIIETVPGEMFRQGIEIQLDNDKETSEAISAELERLGAMEALAWAKSVERGLGGAAIWPVINDSRSGLQTPLVEARHTGIRALHVLERDELYPWKYYTDARHPKFGRPEIYEYRPITPNVAAGGTLIHESRLLVFPGVQVHKATTDGWGDSILVRVWKILRDFNLSWSSAAILLNDFAQAVFRMKGLAEAIAFDKDDLVKTRVQAIELSRSTARAVLIDAEEEFQRTQTPISGLPELLDKFGTRLAAAADMPLTLLMGQSPGGMNATGESDIRFFYDRVAQHQQRVRPQVEQLVKLIMMGVDGPTGGTEPDVWSVKFTPLWQPTEKEVAETRAIVAGTDEKYVAMGAPVESILRSRFGGDTYSMETSIDWAEFDAQKQEQERAAEEQRAAELELAANGGEPTEDKPDEGEQPEAE